MNQLLYSFINWNKKDNNKLDEIINEKYRKNRSFDYFRNIGCIVKFQNDPGAREKIHNHVKICIPVAGGFMVRCYYIDIPFSVAVKLLKGEYDD